MQVMGMGELPKEEVRDVTKAPGFWWANALPTPKSWMYSHRQHLARSFRTTRCGVDGCDVEVA